MKKSFFRFLFLSLLIITVPMTTMAKTVSERLAEDMAAIEMSGAVDIDCVLPKTGPNGSTIEWSWSTPSGANISTLFDADGKYVPMYGSPSAFTVNFTAKLTLEGESIETSFELLSYRTPQYAIHSYIYERPDGTRIRHPEDGAKLVAATGYINPRVKDARVISAIVEDGKVWDISHGMFARSGEIELETSLGDDISSKEQKTFIWKDNLTPLTDVLTLDLSDATDRDFMKNATAVTGDGEDAASVVDRNDATSFVFDKTPQTKDMGKCLYLNQPDSTQTTNQSATYTFTDGLGGKLNVSMDFMLTETVGHKGLLYLFNNDGKELLTLLLKEDAITVVASTAIATEGATGLPKFTAFKWYNLAIDLDTDTDTADIYIDGQLATKVKFRNVSDYLKTMMIYNSATYAGGMYIDNIKVTENGTSHVSEDFSGYEEGTKTITGCKITERGTGTIRVVELYGRRLFLNQPDSTQTANQTASYTFTESLSGSVELSMDFMVTETDGTKGLLYLFNENNEYLLSMYIQGTTMFANNSVSIPTTGAKGYPEIEAYKWYRMKLLLDTETDIADIYVNGQFAERANFRTKSDSLARMLIYNPAREAGGMYIDNVTAKENAELRLSENFNNVALDSNVVSGWDIKEKGTGTVRVTEFTDYMFSLFPQNIVVDIGRVREVGEISVKIPRGIKLKYRIEASETTSGYVRVASHTDSLVSGTVTDDLTRYLARFFKITIVYAENEDGEIVNGGISDIDISLAEIDTPENVAPLAHVTSTSNYYDRTTGDNKFAWDESGLVDGIVGRPGRGEWMAYREGNPTVYFSWDEPQLVDEVVLFETNAYNQNATGALITFDDGDSVRINDIPANGMPRSVTFEEKEVNWMSVQVFGVKGSTGRLSEIQVLKSGDKPGRAKYLSPEYSVKVPKGYESRWLVSEDLDNDGKVDFVGARPLYEGQNHETAAVYAVNLKGEVLWTWGTKSAGTDIPGSDVPCQIYDIDNDGYKEVLISTRSHLVILNGQNGSEKLRFALPVCSTHSTDWASDSICIADITGDGYANDIIVKTRYTDIWAYKSPSNWTKAGDQELLWSACMPNGMKTAHYPIPINLDSDAADEVFIGFCVMDDNGELISKLNKDDFIAPIVSYHVDSIAIMNYAEGMAREDMRFAVSPCGARNFFMIDGNGKKIWEVDTKYHYETLLLGKYVEGGTDKQILTNRMTTDADQISSGFDRVYVYDYNGEQLNEIGGLVNNRYIQSINMTGGEYDYIYCPSDKYVISGDGKVVARLVTNCAEFVCSMRWYAAHGYDNDMDGDGTEDITALGVDETGAWYINIYTNKDGKKTAEKLGTGYNFTYY